MPNKYFQNIGLSFNAHFPERIARYYAIFMDKYDQLINQMPNDNKMLPNGVKTFNY